ncbi:MAG: cupin domain-containing protein [Candidatus Eiseniibacteriota bacterium]
MTAIGQRQDDVPAALRRAWDEAHVAPLWESPTAHKAGPAGARGHVWRWATLRPLIEGALAVQSPAAVERRVLSLVDPSAEAASHTPVSRTIAAAIQILKPGESARPHRHSMNALRFVLEGAGAATIVDGKRCAMAEGDLILTPAWCWHEHVHEGSGPVIWLDVLDVPLHDYLGTSVFEPGPAHDVPPQPDDGAFAAANLVPDLGVADYPHSPVFRYPWAAARGAVDAAPRGADGARRVRYANPLSGGASMPLLDSSLVQLDAELATVPIRSTSSAVCAVVEGTGTSRIGDDEIAWGPKDIFVLPHGAWISHRAQGGAARLFMVSDREVFRRLGLLREELAPAR